MFLCTTFRTPPSVKAGKKKGKKEGREGKGKQGRGREEREREEGRVKEKGKKEKTGKRGGRKRRGGWEKYTVSVSILPKQVREEKLSFLFPPTLFGMWFIGRLVPANCNDNETINEIFVCLVDEPHPLLPNRKLNSFKFLRRTVSGSLS